ncbi:hypothetical protein NEDG_01821 [Nematocida displodere]|uniref:Major facilitator superfamily associated domain-containing protein n=1 Tax=Nematocida displodere TaxID=1805483 RepID=A0A177EH91_9MICR|nr:hypothetical protein NEDG_01821 [Nematocida displodere]
MVYKKLNTSLYLTPKLMYITVNMEYFIFYNFRHPFLQSRGIKDGLDTLTFVLMQFTTFFSNMAMAFFADRIQRPKAVLIMCLVLSAVAFQGLLLDIPKVMCCGLFILYSTFILSTLPLLDRIVLDYLQKVMNAPSSLYGRQRMFGTFTYFVTNYITESLIYDSDNPENKRFGMLGPVYMLYAGIASSMVFLLAPADAVRPLSRTQERNRPQIMQALKSGAYLFFLFIILLNGITRGVLTVYLTSYYKGILDFNKLSPPTNLPKSLQWVMNIFYKNPVSTCSTFGVILEICIFFYSKTILGWTGLYWAFLISQVAQGVRFFAYTQLSPTNPYRFELACAIELLKGINFGLTHLSGVQLAVLLVPSNLKSTSQMIYAGTFVCLGGMLGSLIGYFCKIDTEAGALSMFAAGAVLSAAASLLIAVKYGVMDGKLWGPRALEVPEAPLSAQSSEATLKSTGPEKPTAAGPS